MVEFQTWREHLAYIQICSDICPTARRFYNGNRVKRMRPRHSGDMWSDIWRSQGDDEQCRLTEYDAVQSATNLSTFQRNLLPPTCVQSGHNVYILRGSNLRTRWITSLPTTMLIMLSTVSRTLLRFSLCKTSFFAQDRGSLVSGICGFHNGGNSYCGLLGCDIYNLPRRVI